MTSTLRQLTGAATRSSEDFDSLQQEVQQKKTAMQDLLEDGRASAQVPQGLEACRSSSAGSPACCSPSSSLSAPHQQVKKLLGRAEAARDVANTALGGLQGSSEDLNAALTTLRGERTTVPSAGVRSL